MGGYIRCCCAQRDEWELVDESSTSGGAAVIAPVRERAQQPVNVLDWIATAHQQTTAAQHNLTAAITKDRQASKTRHARIHS